MDQREHGADHQCECRDDFRASRYRTPPRGVDDSKNRRDQRSRMTDSDPENEIGFVKTPEHRPVVAGHADTVVDLIKPGRQSTKHDTCQNRDGDVEACGCCSTGRSRSSARELSRFATHPRIPAADRSLWVWCPVLQAALFRAETAPASRPRFPDRSDRRIPAHWPYTTAHMPAGCLHPSMVAAAFLPQLSRH